jgi:hypothetical protein
MRLFVIAGFVRCDYFSGSVPLCASFRQPPQRRRIHSRRSALLAGSILPTTGFGNKRRSEHVVQARASNASHIRAAYTGQAN